QLKAQSTVLQDFERLNKTMKLVIDTVDAPAMLQRMQSYQALVNAYSAAEVRKTTRDFITFIGRALPYTAPSKRMSLIDAADLDVEYKQVLKEFAQGAPYLSIEDEFIARFLNSRTSSQSQLSGQISVGRRHHTR